MFAACYWSLVTQFGTIMVILKIWCHESWLPMFRIFFLVAFPFFEISAKIPFFWPAPFLRCFRAALLSGSAFLL
jgi:hypothetical protein